MNSSDNGKSWSLVEMHLHVVAVVVVVIIIVVLVSVGCCFDNRYCRCCKSLN